MGVKTEVNREKECRKRERRGWEIVHNILKSKKGKETEVNIIGALSTLTATKMKFLFYIVTTCSNILVMRIKEVITNNKMS